MINHTLFLGFNHVLIDLIREFWDILRISEVKFIWQAHTLHNILLPSLHPLPKYFLDVALLYKAAPLFGEFGLRRILSSCLSFHIVRRQSMSERALIMDVALILWLRHLAGVTAIIVLGEGATHLLIIINTKIMLILFCFLRIGLYLAYILLWTNWLGANLTNLGSGRVDKACHLRNLKDLRCVLNAIANTVCGCCMLAAHSLGTDTVACFLHNPWVRWGVLHLVPLIIII